MTFSPPSEPRFNSTLAQAALVFVILAGVYSLTYSGTLNTTDEHLFVSGAESLGAWGELNTGPVYGVYGAQGNGYVEPGQAVVGAALYQLTRLGQVGAVHALFLLNVYVTALTGVVVFRLTHQHGYRPGVAVAAAFLFGLGTMAWPHTKYYFRDPLAALFVALAVWSYELIFTRRRLAGQAAQWGLTLAFIGCGALSKNTAALVLPAILVATLARVVWADSPGERRAALIGPVAVAALLGLTLLLPAEGMWLRFRLPTYLSLLPALISGFTSAHFGEALVGPLISPGKGLFLESPALSLALIALPGVARRDWRRVLVPWLTLLGLVLASATVHGDLWWGGTGWGVRHLLPAVPLLTVACAPALQFLANAKSAWIKLTGGGWLLISGLAQVGGVMASPADYYNYWKSGVAPGVPWTVGIWDPRYVEVVGYWKVVLSGRPWDFAWVRLFPVNSFPVAALLIGWLAVIAASLWALRNSILAGWPLKREKLGLSLMLLLAVVLLPYSLLRAYYPDPYYSAARADFRAAAEYVAQNAHPGDVVAVRGYIHPLWFFYLNYARSPVPWYAFNPTVPDAIEWQLIRDWQSPDRSLSPETASLFSKVLPARYTRLWLVNDFGAPGGDNRLEEWWLTQNDAPVRTEVFREPGQVAVTLFALSPPQPDAAQSVDFRFGDEIRLKRFALRRFAGRATYQPGDVLPLSLEWSASQTPSVDFNIGVYLLDSAGVLRVQQDGLAVNGFYSTTVWQPNEDVVDNHGLALPIDLAPGDYRLAVAVYDWKTGVRLPAGGPTGPLPEGLAYLTTIHIGNPS